MMRRRAASARLAPLHRCRLWATRFSRQPGGDCGACPLATASWRRHEMRLMQKLFSSVVMLSAAPLAAHADSQSDLVARGQYVTTAADCEACHTTPGGQPFAGGRAFVLPFGVLYSPNITPDQKTGIAGYSDADWIRMLHKGIGRDGK